MKKWTKLLALLLALCLVLPLVPSAVADANAPARGAKLPQNTRPASGGVTVTEIEDPGYDLTRDLTDTSDFTRDETDPYEMVRAIIVFDEPALLDEGYSANEIAQYGAQVISASRAINTRQETIIDRINQAVSSAMAQDGIMPIAQEPLEINYRYNVLFSGVSMTVPYGAMGAIQKVDGVARAFVAEHYSVPEDMSGTAQPYTSSSTKMVGAPQAWDVGFTGEGMRIAIIDTGLDTDHPAFAGGGLPENSSYLTKDDIADVLDELHASEAYRNLTVDDLYYSDKVPFGFNYVDATLDVTHDNDQQGDHGTHVAGIAAANQTAESEVVGVAPDAQILVMKVFGTEGGAWMDDVAAALEDCFWLEADAVNMSLGQDSGFSVSGDEWMDEIFAKVADHGMILAVAAGNSTSAAYGNATRTNKNPAQYPDNGIISSPATYAGATSVASCDNAAYQTTAFEVAGVKYPYVEYYEVALPFAGLTKGAETKDLPYILVPGKGSEADFASLGKEVEGKIAVIERGGLDFTVKQENAFDAGAIAVIVYNNTDAALDTAMADAGVLPNVIVPKATGDAMKAAAVDGVGTVTVYRDPITINDPHGGKMSEYSNWGVAPDLTLEPDITAPGGNIYSTLTDGTYGYMSGTSMASPQLAGMAALVLQYLRQEHPELSESELHTVAEALLMSTAAPIMETGTLPYSPRWQGAGLAQVDKAVTSPAYLTISSGEGKEKTPKASLGDSTSGVYSFTFTLNNLSDQPHTYTMSATLLTDQYQTLEGVDYMTETGHALVDSQVAFSGGNSVTVQPNSSISVTATVTLGAQDMAYMKDHYANGIYVDGFVTLKASDPEDPDLGMPLMGFFGEWSQAPAFDTGWWWDLMNNEVTYERFPHALLNDNGIPLGVNPYMDERTDPKHNVVSPNGDFYDDGLIDIYVSLLRNAKELIFTWKDSDGTPLHTATYPYARKTTYNQTYGQQIPIFLSDVVSFGTATMFDFTKDGVPLPNDSVVTLEISAKLDDGDDVVDQTLKPITVTIDTEAPTVVEGSAYQENGELHIKVQDNQYIAAVIPVTDSGSGAKYYPVDNEPGQPIEVVVDLAGLNSSFQLAVCDYAYNETYYTVTLEDPATFDFDSWYAFRYKSWLQDDFGLSGTTYYNGWYTFKPENSETMYFHSPSFQLGELDVVAAEYVDGYLLGIDEMGAVFSIQPGAWDRTEVGAVGPYSALDMALDYTDETLYVLAGNEEGEQYLLVLDPLTGSVTKETKITGAPSELLTLAAADGKLYTVDADLKDASLYTIDKTTGKVTSVGKTGVATGVEVTDYDWDTESMVTTVEGFHQTMAVDHDNDNALYWLFYKEVTNPDGYTQTPTGQLLSVDKGSGAATKLTDNVAAAEMTGLMIPSKNCPDILPDDTKPTELTLSMDSLDLVAGSQGVLSAIPTPYYADLTDLTWESSVETVATVDKGLVTALTPGTTVVTAKCGDAEATCVVTVITIEGELYFYEGTAMYQWAEIDVSDPADGSYIEESISPAYSITAAAYDGNLVYAYDAQGNFYHLDPATLNGEKFGSVQGSITGMAFNPVDGELYGLLEESFGDFWDSYQVYTLIRISKFTGEYERVAVLDDQDAYQYNYGIAIDPDGTFYFGVTNDYFTIVAVKATLEGDTLTVLDSQPVGLVALNVRGSMTYSTESEALFLVDDNGMLLWIRPSDLKGVYVGGIMGLDLIAEGTCMNLGLLELKDPGLPEEKAVSATAPEEIQLVAGGTAPVVVDVKPWDATSAITYKTADGSIATVDEFGVVTGVAPGTTTLTITVDGMTLTVKITVLASGGYLHGMAVQEFSGMPLGMWINFPDADPSMGSMDNNDLYETETSVYAGAYYNGKIYAYIQSPNEDGDYYSYFGTFDLNDDYAMELISRMEYSIMDMAFDYTRGALYAVESGGKLLEIDLKTGETVVVGDTGHSMVSVTCDDHGQLYAISTDGTLYRVDGVTGAATEIGPTGLTSCSGYQSMLYDFNSGNTYWSYMNLNGPTGGLYLVNLETGAASELGTIVDGTMVTSLYTIPAPEPQVPATVEVDGLVFDKDTVVIPAGENGQLNVHVLPISVRQVDTELTWTSSDPSIATVDENGLVTGVASGVVTITVTDAQGHTATITVVVPAEGRKIFAYDETNGQWVSFDETGAPTVERADEPDEERLKASYYVQSQDVIYAYGEDGGFYAIDPYTFQRTQLGQVTFGEYEHWDGETYPIVPVDMAYDSSTGKMYLAAEAMSVTENGFYGAHAYLYEVDLATGALTPVLDTEELLFGNLLAQNGMLYTMDVFDSGMFTVIDPNTGAMTKAALVQGYWSEPTSSISFYVDELTGTIYAIRDYAGGGIYGNGDTPEPYLYVFNMNDASLEEVFAMAGDAYYNGVFVREPVEDPILPSQPTPPSPDEPVNPPVIPPVDPGYEITDGNGDNWNGTGDSGLTFQANGPASGLMGIYVDGKLVPPGSYTVNPDGSVTLSPAYLATLTSGAHTITIQYANGSATGTFTVRGTGATHDSANDTPKTNDTALPALWAAALVFSALGMAILVPGAKKYLKK